MAITTSLAHTDGYATAFASVFNRLSLLGLQARYQIFPQLEQTSVLQNLNPEAGDLMGFFTWTISLNPKSLNFLL